MEPILYLLRKNLEITALQNLTLGLVWRKSKDEYVSKYVCMYALCVCMQPKSYSKGRMNLVHSLNPRKAFFTKEFTEFLA